MPRKLRGVNPESLAVGSSCRECQETGGWWLHLRRCAECGHIGCCDSSPNQHALKHARIAGHPVVASFEPLQNWFFDYEKRTVFRGHKLLPPDSHPDCQSAPGPKNRVPENWEELLNEL